MRAQGRLHTIGRFLHAGDRIGIQPIALQVGGKEQARVLDRLHAVGHHRGGHESREAELGHKH